MGEDRKLLRWERIVEYMNLAAKASDRVRVQELGKSTNKNPFILVVISAPGTLKDLPRYQATQKALAYPYDLADPEALKRIQSHKAVMLITCNIHATEIGSSQMVLELVHRLATEDSPFIQNILDNVIFLLVPSFNPDGQIIVTDWYNKNLGTPYEYSPLPELYHKYTGHDNNRDAFMNTQAESRLVNRLTYKDWFPVVYLDEHQMGNAGARIFVPPFRDPINPNVDPGVWQLNGLLGYAMGAALHERGYAGVVSDQTYTSWWQGGFLMQAWWHNMAGLLTEVASVAVATPVEQERARLGEPPRGPEMSREQLRERDPRRPLPAPRDVIPRHTYPKPWLGGRWTLRDIVDYELAATYGLLEAVANNREMLVRSFYRMNRKQIEMGKKEAPYAWVIPAAQHDPPVAARMLQILDELGVEVHRASDTFEANGRKYPAGTHVVLMAQPFRAFVKDMLEKQVYPPGPRGERPYDVTGWTLPMQMGVKAEEIASAFTAKLERVTAFPAPPGRLEKSGNPVVYQISHAQNNAAIAVNRLLAAGDSVSWSPDGGIIVRGDVAGKLSAMAEQLGIEVKGLEGIPSMRALRRPRIGLHQPHSSSMDEGWTRWLLEQYEFPYSVLRSVQVREGRLRDKFDAIVVADGSKQFLMEGLRGEWVHPDVRGGLEKEGVEALREFVRQGGTLITLGSASLVPIEEFPLPLKNTLRDLRPEQFSCPGSILRVFVDNQSPVGFGMPDQASAVFYNDVAFEMAPGFADSTVRTIARYPAGDLLQSGWIGGPEHLHDKIAAAEVSYGKGRVILLGFSVQNRAQPHGTFKLLFNSLHYAALE
jgi:hypothetical protein